MPNYGRAGQRTLNFYGDKMAEYKGIVRGVDHLGRIVIPKEIRKQLEITDGADYLEMQLSDNGELILKKHKSGCIFCGETSFLVPFKKNFICKSCLDELVIEASNPTSLTM